MKMAFEDRKKAVVKALKAEHNKDNGCPCFFLDELINDVKFVKTNKELDTLVERTHVYLTEVLREAGIIASNVVGMALYPPKATVKKTKKVVA